MRAQIWAQNQDSIRSRIKEQRGRSDRRSDLIVWSENGSGAALTRNRRLKKLLMFAWREVEKQSCGLKPPSPRAVLGSAVASERPPRWRSDAFGPRRPASRLASQTLLLSFKCLCSFLICPLFSLSDLLFCFSSSLCAADEAEYWSGATFGLSALITAACSALHQSSVQFQVQFTGVVSLRETWTVYSTLLQHSDSSSLS